jgi:DNA polymerase delta subunit 1
MGIDFQALTWEAKDDEDGYGYFISIIGKTGDGRSVCVTTSYNPYFFIRLPDNFSSTKTELFQIIEKKYPGYVVSHETVKRKCLWGFQNNEENNFVRLEFKNLESKKRLDYFFRRPVYMSRGPTMFKVYEANLDPLLRFMHDTGIKSAGWLNTGDHCVRAHRADVDVDLFCNDWSSLTPVDKDDVAPFVVASVDIECNSSTGKFPSPRVPDDACFQIAITLCHLGSEEPYRKTCLCYKETDPDPDSGDIVWYPTEKEMLEAFTAYVHEHNVDIITGWNIFGFDLQYLYRRAVHTGARKFMFLGRLKGVMSSLQEKILSSSALGDNKLLLLPMPGRFVFDLFQEVKKGYKLDSYSLNSVSKLYLGDEKIDMSPKEMFARYREGDPHKLMEVARYCIKDTLLPHRLLKRLCTLLNLLEMANATWVPLDFLVTRGQQIKVFSQLAKKAKELGFMVPTIYKDYKTEKVYFGKEQIKIPEGYVGATVLDAQKGAYYSPITALDFASLYPSIMMAHNLCYSTLVKDPKYGNIPGITYEEFEVGGETYKFAQDVPSLLPSILNELKAFRKKAKKDMASATGFMKEIYNGKQLAYKISMNSMYGFTGVKSGMLPCSEIASTTTAKGRSMIEETKTYVEKHFPGAIVRYGDTDSVMVEFDCEGRTGMDAIKYSWDLGERAAEECTKLFKKPNDLELEKTYYPYILYSKKRYAAKLWTKGKDGEMHMDYIDVKGLSLVRRDNTPHVREVCKELLDLILESNDTKPAIELARERALELLTGDVPHEKLILSQQLGDLENYKSHNMSHVQVHLKMEERKPGSAPQSGDRVPYLLTKTEAGHRAKAFEKAEDPKYVLENKIPVDYHYYFLNKFLKPVSDLLEPLVNDAKEEIFGEIISQYKPPRAKPVRKSKEKQTTLDSIFKNYETTISKSNGSSNTEKID